LDEPKWAETKCNDVPGSDLNPPKEKLMFKKLASVVIITAIVCTLGGTSALANNKSDPAVNNDPANASSEAPAKRDAECNEQLKNKMLKLVSDAKAGKVIPPAKSQIQPTTGNNLSKRTKIAIGVGIAVVVVAIIVVKHAKDHLFDDFTLF
jgi:hypothetical protein